MGSPTRRHIGAHKHNGAVAWKLTEIDEMVICAVVNCHNRSDKGESIRFFRLPAVITHQGAQAQQLSSERQQKWISKINRKDLTPERYPNVRICAIHFVSGSPAQLFDQANPDWAPTLNMGYSNDKQVKCASSTSRYNRAKERSTRKRRRSKTHQELASDCNTSVVIEDQEPSEEVPGIEAQTELSTKDLENLEKKMKELEKEVSQLKHDNTQQIEVIRHLKTEYGSLLFTQDSFKEDDGKVLYYTGLGSMKLFSTLLAYIEPYLKDRSSLTKFQQLLLTLMRLRLSLSGQDLGYRFQIHQSSVSRIFEYVIGVLYSKLKPLIKWPDRDALRKTMPMVFRKHYPNCVVIIDCFEIFIDRPTNLLARAQTYSQYKHHNTVKYLIGITPQGSVSYISSGWGGRTSDKHITENSSFLTNLVPGDLILADRGFDIRDTLGTYSSKLEMPAFTRGKSQLSGIEVEQTRRIANVRIHVERVIGNIRKKYSILSDTQPIDFLVSPDGSCSLLDKIVHVCCALNNICDSVISFE